MKCERCKHKRHVGRCGERIFVDREDDRICECKHMSGEDQQVFTPDGIHLFYVPDNTMLGLKRYIEDGIEIGGFLKAVLMNDLQEAYGRADIGNILNMFATVSWLYNFAPKTCWGSKENVENWIAAKKKAYDDPDRLGKS